ncbi:MAG TPA: efflux RND transporter periplasmic adaptor subunit [Planctomycetaceae bacterium]|jgi:RND family efflux transporter MFP subunit|nr:efflux RND transporter periplasmic adaptor subunit [Planctomycetaceae bacterium]
MKKKKHRLIAALFVGAGFLAMAWTLGYAGFGGPSAEALPVELTGEQAPAGAVAVTLQSVALRPVQRTIETVGTLHPFEQVIECAKVEGRVRRIVHDVGDRVKPGDLLLEVDPTDFELSVRQAQRALEVEQAKLGLAEVPTGEFDVSQLPVVVEADVKATRAKERLDRVRALVERSAMSKDELGNATSDARSLEAERQNQILMAKSGLAMVQMKQEALAIVTQQLRDSRIIAPRPSTNDPNAVGDMTYAVTSRSAAEGSFVRIGTEVFKLVIDRILKLKVPVPDRYVAEVKEGQKVTIRTAAYDKSFEGTVTRINPSVDLTTRTFEVEIQVPNPDGVLKSGSFAKAAIITRMDPETQTVPLDAVVRFAGITKIFLQDGEHARELQVIPGATTSEWIEIVSPKLPAGAQVVTSGQSLLSDGLPIFVRRASETAARTASQEQRQQ